MKLSLEQIEQLNCEMETIVERYQELSAQQLARIFNINMSAKNAFHVLAHKIIEDSESNTLSDLLSEVDFRVKTIRLDRYGGLKEAMSLPVFKYCELVLESWETSKLRDYFHQKVFMFLVFRANGKELYLNKIILWKMPKDILDNSVRKVWERMKNVLAEGKIVKYIDDYGRYFTYFPSAVENPYVHVRPHAQNRQDVQALPVADKLTGLVKYPKHSFWLNRSYILKIVTREE